MSKESLAKVVQRAISDAGFRRQLNSDPAGALRGFDLSADEVSALRSGNAGRLSTLGVDQRMSKAFAIGGVAATRSAESDLTAGNATVLDDGSGAGGSTIIPRDPEAASTADRDGAAGTRSAIRDDPDGLLALKAKEAVSGSGRIGDDWKFTDRAAAANAAPVEGSPEADAAARLDDASGVSGGPRAIRDDPDGLLASKAQAEATGGSAPETAFINDSEGYLTPGGYDANAATSAVTDAHDRGDVTRIDDDADSAGTSAASENGPTDH